MQEHHVFQQDELHFTDVLHIEWERANAGIQLEITRHRKHTTLQESERMLDPRLVYCVADSHTILLPQRHKETHYCCAVLRLGQCHQTEERENREKACPLFRRLLLVCALNVQIVQVVRDCLVDIALRRHLQLSDLRSKNCPCWVRNREEQNTTGTRQESNQHPRWRLLMPAAHKVANI